MQNVQGTPWSIKDYQYLHEHYNMDGADRCAVALGRSPSAVSAKASKLLLDPQGEFTDEEIRLAKSYGNFLGTALIFIMPNRTHFEIEALLQCVNK